MYNNLQKFKLSIRMVVGGRVAGLSIIETAELLEF